MTSQQTRVRVCDLGPLVGGLGAQFLGRRVGFLVNLPVAAAGILLVVLARPTTPRHPVTSWDLPGTVALVVGSGGVLLALLQGPTWGWGSPSTLLAAAGGALVTALLVRRCLVRPDAVVDLRLLGERRFRGGAIVLTCLGFAMTAVPADRRGQASGLVSMLRQAGGIIGVGAMGALIAGWPSTPDGGPAQEPVAIGFALAAVVVLGAAVVAARTLGAVGPHRPASRLEASWRRRPYRHRRCASATADQ